MKSESNYPDNLTLHYCCLQPPPRFMLWVAQYVRNKQGMPNNCETSAWNSPHNGWLGLILIWKNRNACAPKSWQLMSEGIQKEANAYIVKHAVKENSMHWKLDNEMHRHIQDCCGGGSKESTVQKALTREACTVGSSLWWRCWGSLGPGHSPRKWVACKRWATAPSNTAMQSSTIESSIVHVVDYRPLWPLTVVRGRPAGLRRWCCHTKSEWKTQVTSCPLEFAEAIFCLLVFAVGGGGEGGLLSYTK